MLRNFELTDVSTCGRSAGCADCPPPHRIAHWASLFSWRSSIRVWPCCWSCSPAAAAVSCSRRGGGQAGRYRGYTGHPCPPSHNIRAFYLVSFSFNCIAGIKMICFETGSFLIGPSTGQVLLRHTIAIFQDLVSLNLVWIW